MPFDGLGNYSLPTNSFAQPVSTTVINPTDATALWADLTTALSTCVVDNQTASPTLKDPIIDDAILDTSSNELLEFGVTGTAVNHLKITNAATGTVPAISTAGEADIGIDFENLAGEEMLQLVAIDVAVNNIKVTNAATGNAPFVSAVGDDTNIDVEVTPKGTGALTYNGTAVSRIVTETVQATTSGTSVNWSSLPSWINKITVSLDQVSQSSTSCSYDLRIGTGGVSTTSGYASGSTRLETSNAISIDTSTSGFVLAAFSAAAGSELITGNITLINTTGNVWVVSGTLLDAFAGLNSFTASGTVTLAGTLDYLEVLTTGTAYDNGQINIIYEG